MPSSQSTSPSPGSALSAMLEELRRRCPVLCPGVVPSGCHDAEHGVALLSLCRDAEEKQALALLLKQRRASVGTKCALTGRSADDESEMRFVSTWELDVHASAYRLTRCAFVCTEAAMLLDTAGMLERFSRTSADAKELGRLATIFCEANASGGADINTEARTGVKARQWLQECLNLAAACQVLASSMPRPWGIVGPDETPLGKGMTSGGAVALVRGLLGAKASRGANTGGKPRRDDAAVPDEEDEGSSKARKKRKKAAAA